MAVYEWGSGSSPDNESFGTFTLDFSAFRTLRNECVLFIIHPVYGIPLQQSEQTKIVPNSQAIKILTKQIFINQLIYTR